MKLTAQPYFVGVTDLEKFPVRVSRDEAPTPVGVSTG